MGLEAGFTGAISNLGNSCPSGTRLIRDAEMTIDPGRVSAQGRAFGPSS
jgi:hypothetical protein